jgi:hypothetical protein
MYNMPTARLPAEKVVMSRRNRERILLDLVAGNRWRFEQESVIGDQSSVSIDRKMEDKKIGRSEGPIFLPIIFLSSSGYPGTPDDHRTARGDPDHAA